MNKMVNIDVRSDGTIRPRKQFKSFRGMVHQLWLINRRYKRMGIVGDFTVRLPLPETKPFYTQYETAPIKMDDQEPPDFSATPKLT